MTNTTLQMYYHCYNGYKYCEHWWVYYFGYVSCMTIKAIWWTANNAVIKIVDYVEYWHY